MELSELILEGNWEAASAFLEDESIPVSRKREIVNKGCPKSRAGSMLNVTAKLNAPTELVKKLLEIGDPQTLLKVGNSGFNPLHYACTSEIANLDLIELLLNVGGKELAVTKGRNDITALHKVCSLKVPDPRVVDMLTKVGGEDLVRIQNKDGTTALHFVCKNESPSIKIINMLIEVAGDSILLQRNNNGKTASEVATVYAKRNTKFLQWLEQKQSSVQCALNQEPHHVNRRRSTSFIPTSKTEMNANQPHRLSERRKSTTSVPTPTTMKESTTTDQDKCKSPTRTSPTSFSTTKGSTSQNLCLVKRRSSTFSVPISTTDRMKTTDQDHHCHRSEKRTSSVTVPTTPTSSKDVYINEGSSFNTVNQLPRSLRLNRYLSSTGSSSPPPPSSPTKWMDAKIENDKLKEENAKLLEEKNRLENSLEKNSLDLQMDLGMQVFDLKVEREQLLKQSSQLFQENYKLRHELKSNLEKVKTLELENEALNRKLLAMNFGSSFVSQTSNNDNDVGGSLLTFPMPSESSSFPKNPHSNLSSSEPNDMNHTNPFHFNFK